MSGGVVATAAARGGRQLAVLWAVAALALVLLSPFGGLFAGALPACPFKEMTGIPCPSCGATRSALALADFQLLEALLRYPLPTLAWVGFVLGGFTAGGLALVGRGLPALPRLPSWARWSLLGVFLGHWAYSIATGV